MRRASSREEERASAESREARLARRGAGPGRGPVAPWVVPTPAAAGPRLPHPAREEGQGCVTPLPGECSPTSPNLALQSGSSD